MMNAMVLSLTGRDTRRQQQLAMAWAITTAIAALLATPSWAQTTSPAPSQSPPAQTSSGSAGQANQPAQAQPGGSGSATSRSSTTAQPAQSTQPGVRAVDAASLRMTFYTVRPVDMLATNLIGLDVHNLKNEEIGEIEDLIVDNGKMIRGIVLGIGGFLGLGERHTAVDPGAIVITQEAGGSLKAVVNTTREELQKAPEFKFEGNMTRRK